MTPLDAVPTDAPSPAPSPTPRSRLPLHHVYYLLAAFDLVTVTLSLGLIFWITTNYERSVADNNQWADRLADCLVLSNLAAEVNAPGNFVFNQEQQRASGQDDDAWIASHRVDLAAAHAAFLTRAGALKAALHVLEHERAGSLVAHLDDVHGSMGSMMAEAEAIFVALPDRLTAGDRMAEMDRHYHAVSSALGSLNADVIEIQQDLLNQQIQNAQAVWKFEALIAGLILVMVAAVAVYGHQLAQQTKRSSQQLVRYRDHLEALVDARTTELQASHEQLRLAERLASIGTLAAGLGHDINNVLFPVRCRLDALDHTDVPEKVAGELAAVRRSVDFLQQLADGLRLLSLDPDDPHASRGFTQLEPWWAEAGPMIRSALPKSARIEVDLPAGLPPVAVAPHALTQAVFNLAVNAGEVIDARGTVAISAHRVAGDRVRLQVRDDGPGMTEDVRRQALDPFFTTKKRALSTGLGLALVHGVAKAAGGAVDIESVLGSGTTVSLTVPVAREAATPLPPGADQRATVTLRDQRIASFVETLLASVGFTVEPWADHAIEHVSVWVTDPDRAALERAGRFAGNGERDAGRRRIIVYGGSADEREPWRRFDPVTIDSEGGLAAIQAAIRSVVGASQTRTRTQTQGDT